MISAWWLLLTIPACFTCGMVIGGIFGDGQQADRCSVCQYKCLNCDLKKEKSK